MQIFRYLAIMVCAIIGKKNMTDHSYQPAKTNQPTNQPIWFEYGMGAKIR